jgi:Predicted metal-binding protein
MMSAKWTAKIFKQRLGLTDYKWIDPARIVVAQWVRMKCMFGCGNYGRHATCPPNTPPVAECERFFGEYSDAVIFHFAAFMKDPEDRHLWNAKVNRGLNKLERQVFVKGYERAFLMFLHSCGACKECSPTREGCHLPRLGRPAPEAMAIDVFSTVRQYGFPIQVLAEYDQEMNRYAFLLLS